MERGPKNPPAGRPAELVVEQDPQEPQGFYPVTQVSPHPQGRSHSLVADPRAHQSPCGHHSEVVSNRVVLSGCSGRGAGEHPAG